MKVEDDIMTAERYEEMTATDAYSAREEQYMQAVHRVAIATYLGSFYGPLSALLLSDPHISSSGLQRNDLNTQEQVLANLGLEPTPPNGAYNVFPNLKGVEIDIQDVRCREAVMVSGFCELLLPVLRALRGPVSLGAN